MLSRSQYLKVYTNTIRAGSSLRNNLDNSTPFFFLSSFFFLPISCLSIMSQVLEDAKKEREDAESQRRWWVSY
jgi:hypothetical protein